MNEWLRSHLVCPRDKEKVECVKDSLICPKEHIYPVIEDIPIMLVDEVEETHHHIPDTLRQVAEYQTDEPKQKRANCKNGVDEYVQIEIPHTSGTLYFSLVNKLTRYPIPDLRLMEGHGKRFLDIGCNWGRWSIAAARKGYKPVGIDPSLDACLAARRVAKQLCADADFVVGDARFLPFAADSFDVAFSCLVLQCFSKPNAKLAFAEIARAIKKDGKVFVQMPNKYGIRSLFQQWRRGFTEGEDFDVRYWTPSELIETFEAKFGKTEMTTDCFFGLGIQRSDADLLPLRYKIIVHSSEVLRKISNVIKPLTKVADSVYLESVNQKRVEDKEKVIEKEIV